SANTSKVPNYRFLADKVFEAIKELETEIGKSSHIKNESQTGKLAGEKGAAGIQQAKMDGEQKKVETQIPQSKKEEEVKKQNPQEEKVIKEAECPEKTQTTKKKLPGAAA
uniref:Uncharacterized protein n=1 Tax=Parascaris univalens TaxID=6257 RepID=A0A915A2D2_PARUN